MTAMKKLLSHGNTFTIKTNNKGDMTFIRDRSSRPEVFLGKGVLKICIRFRGEHPCRSVISIILLCSFIKIAFWHGCPSVNLMHIVRTPFPKNTSGWLLLKG